MSYLLGVDWLVRILEVFIVIFILVVSWKKRWSLLFGGKKSLKTQSDHELHSCFISAFTLMAFHIVGVVLGQYVLKLKLEVTELRQLFYFIVFLNSLGFASVLFGLHVIRGCSYSLVARRCLWLTSITMLLITVQFVSHGLFEKTWFNTIYQYGVVTLNAISLLVVSKYPFQMLKTYSTKEV
ncbi:hypothetical protein JL49_09130 [Pseudoalteromonas luteoviolacea]|nr:hypothetical protein JL49_09130 [Pseudoalteromonas luteoviolacea]